MTIRGLLMDPVSNMPIVILKDVAGESVLPIWVGVYEANAIALEMEKVSTPRPMTHDLIKNVLTGLETHVHKVVVTELREDTFFAVIWLERGGEVVSIDSRPSDALALALRVDCPIFVDELVLKNSKQAANMSDRVLSAMQRLYTREQYMERIAWMKSAKREISITSDIIVGFPGETEEDFAETLALLDEVGYDAVFTFKYSPRPNTPSLALDDAIPDEEKVRRLEVLNARQRQIQTTSYKKYIGTISEVMVEGRNESRNQWIGRTSQNKTLNFTAPEISAPKIGTYVPVRATVSFPNSLLGELVV